MSAQKKTVAERIRDSYKLSAKGVGKFGKRRGVGVGWGGVWGRVTAPTRNIFYFFWSEIGVLW